MLSIIIKEEFMYADIIEYLPCGSAVIQSRRNVTFFKKEQQPPLDLQVKYASLLGLS